jgi:hypothetical protein
MEEQVKKRKPRRGATICPDCGTSMRVVFISKDIGGFQSIPEHVGCGKCLKVRRIAYQDVEEVVTHVVVKTTEVNP